MSAHAVQASGALLFLLLLVPAMLKEATAEKTWEDQEAEEYANDDASDCSTR